MNEALIAAWNERVTGNDTVFILGDLFYRCADPLSLSHKKACTSPQWERCRLFYVWDGTEGGIAFQRDHAKLLDKY